MSYQSSLSSSRILSKAVEQIDGENPCDNKKQFISTAASKAKLSVYPESMCDIDRASFVGILFLSSPIARAKGELFYSSIQTDRMQMIGELCNEMGDITAKIAEDWKYILVHVEDERIDLVIH